MIAKVDIDAVRMNVSPELQKYVLKKITRLDRYVPKMARGSLHVIVKLREVKSQEKKRFSCEVIMHLPGEVIAAKESTINMFAAVDIVEQKLKTQLKKYKALHGGQKSSHKDSKVRDFMIKIRRRRWSR